MEAGDSMSGSLVAAIDEKDLEGPRVLACYVRFAELGRGKP